MNFKKTNLACTIIQKIADDEGIPAAEVRREMAAAIDEAWKNQDENTVRNWKKLFPSGRKPSVEFFVLRLTEELRNTNSDG